MRLRVAGILSLLLLSFVAPQYSPAGKGLMIAVAANYAPAMERMIDLFTKETGIPAQMTISSTGRLYAQIKNEAPYELFYAADAKRPELLFSEKKCDEPVRYALGQVVLWSKKRELCSYADWQDVVTSDTVHKIAIANPEIAPYGTAAKDAVDQANLAGMKSKLIYSGNVGQSFQYAVMGLVDAAFIARSHAQGANGKKGCVWEVSEAKKIEQQACVITYGKNKDTARRFLEFTLSDRVASIREEFGYGK